MLVSPFMETEKIKKLTPAQSACLRLVLPHYTSKDIARQLGSSPHTVDNHIKAAMARLGASSRFDAARQLAEYESEVERRALASQSSGISTSAANRDHLLHNDSPERVEEVDRNCELHDIGSSYRPDGFNMRRPKILPLPEFWGEKNALTTKQRLIWMIILTVSIALAMGAILASLSALESIL